MIKIFNLLAPERVKILRSGSKTDALTEICRMISTSESIKDPAELERAVFERERIMSTSIGLGIAIPHVRLKSVGEMTMAIGVIRDGIDYDAFDGQPVNTIIMIAAPEGSHREYLSILARLALLLKNASIRNAILNTEDTVEIYELFRTH